MYLEAEYKGVNKSCRGGVTDVDIVHIGLYGGVHRTYKPCDTGSLHRVILSENGSFKGWLPRVYIHETDPFIFKGGCNSPPRILKVMD